MMRNTCLEAESVIDYDATYDNIRHKILSTDTYIHTYMHRGRPALPYPTTPYRSLAHCGSRVLCLLCRSVPVGVSGRGHRVLRGQDGQGRARLRGN